MPDAGSCPPKTYTCFPTRLADAPLRALGACCTPSSLVKGGATTRFHLKAPVDEFPTNLHTSSNTVGSRFAPPKTTQHTSSPSRASAGKGAVQAACPPRPDGSSAGGGPTKGAGEAATASSRTVVVTNDPLERTRAAAAEREGEGEGEGPPSRGEGEELETSSMTAMTDANNEEIRGACFAWQQAPVTSLEEGYRNKCV